jgi:hypothetical protein
MLQRPHVFPEASLMNPFSPQDGPQEFLTHHAPELIPTKVTPWLSLVEQLSKTPELYLDQLVASTAIDRGCLATSVAKLLQSLTSVNPEILNSPLSCEQVCLTALYG